MAINRKIEEKTDREWLLLRPQNIIGAVQELKQSGFILENGNIVFKDYRIVPAFLKIVNEIIDNTIDVYIKSGGKSATKIDITIKKGKIKVKDNGYGIPVEKNDDGNWMPYIAWGRPRAGSNFNDEDNQGQLGMNGVGSYATAVFSKKFVGTTCDGKKKQVITFLDNLETEKVSLPIACKTAGTTVEFEPDLARFGLTEIGEDYINAIKFRLMNISFSYPKINFTFNGEKISVSTKTFITKFGENSTIFDGGEYVIAVIPNESDDFRFFSYVNGLHNSNGGNHIDLLLEKFTYPLRDKLQRRYKGIKPGDIKNKMTLVVFFRGFIEAKFEGQIKEKFTSPVPAISKYLAKFDFVKAVDKLALNKALTEPIIDVYRAKEEIARRKALKDLSKPKKEIQSEKYLPATQKRKYLLICEGASASGGLMPALGRDEFGYFELKGIPLNAYEAPQSKFTDNAELSLLYQIIKNEGYEYYIYATDQDLDGFKIRGLMNGFFLKYAPTIIKGGRVGMLQTPIMGSKKAGKLHSWVYRIEDSHKLKAGEQKYYKGLGSWTVPDLQLVLKTDGFNKMVDMLEFDDEAAETIDAWLNSKRVPDRKEFLRNNDFDLIKM